MSRRLRAVLFDAGNTLVFLDPERMSRLFAAEGIRVAEDRIVEVELRAREELTRRMRPGSTGLEPGAWRRYFRRIFRGAGVPWWRMSRVARRLRETPSLIAYWSHVHHRTGPTLTRLKEDGYRIAVISNADGTMADLLQDVGLSEHFEFIIDSGSVAWEKPDPRIFHDAVTRLGVAPHEALYVGDLYHVDVVGARAAGLEAVLIDPSDRQRHDVESIRSVAHLPEYLGRRYL